ncbi:hypothetical protein [Polluticoccus soli]|uniref:hypothetical protein n=1 Tax=Polluticoccus soli TaxID=3034150 RepID=UPI0023E23FAF|nr:hypothetical protein [Flavipsychrobacter sp. JY13-12]
MKNLILICLLLPAVAAAQSQDDCEQAMVRFSQYYNEQNSKKIIELFAPQTQQFVETAFDKENIGDLIKRYGPIQSFKYIGVTREGGMIIFKTQFENQTLPTGFTLEESNKFGTFRFNARSDEIDEMMLNSQ